MTTEMHSIPDIESLINALLPNESAWSRQGQIEEILTKSIDHVDIELDSAHNISANAQEADYGLDLQRTLTATRAEIRVIQEKAQTAEHGVQSVIGSIKSLDIAKRNIITSVILLRRLQMLAHAYERLAELAEGTRLNEIANLLNAVRELTTSLKNFQAVPRVSTLCRAVVDLEIRQKEWTFSKLRELTKSKKIDNEYGTNLCLIIDALGEAARTQFIDWYCTSMLKEYRKVFDPKDEAGSLDNLERRFAWYQRLQRSTRELIGRVFPISWNVESHLRKQFAESTLAHLNQSLADRSPKVSLLVSSLQIANHFDATTVKSLNQHASIPMLASAFKPYLHIWVEAKDIEIKDIIQRSKTTELEKDLTSSSVLPSATDLFLTFREILDQCLAMSQGDLVLQLTKVMQRDLKIYADDILLANVERANRFSNAVNDRTATSLTAILNTAEYCRATTDQLQSNVKIKFKAQADGVTFQVGVDAFIEIIARSIVGLVHCISLKLEYHVLAMGETNWSQVHTVGDQSSWMSFLQRDVKEIFNALAQRIEQKDSYRDVCDRFVQVISARLSAQMTRCAPITEVGAEQILLDIQSFKGVLASLRKDLSGTTNSDAIGYSNLLQKSIGPLEGLLKVLMTPTSPALVFVQTFMSVVAKKDETEYIRMLRLKGVPKAEDVGLIRNFREQQEMAIS